MAELSIDVPASEVGKLIGPNGSTLRRLMQSTGCKIEIPKGDRDSSRDAKVSVQLSGTPAQADKAKAAIQDVIDGGDFEDHAARAEGALLAEHGFEDWERRSWLAWRLVREEHQHRVRADMGRKAVRIWKAGPGPALSGAAAEAVRKAVLTAIEEAREIVELSVEALLEYEPENAGYDLAVRCLTDQHGVLLRVKEAEDGAIPLRVWGPPEAARDAALMIEARWNKGKHTCSLLQAPGQVQAMTDKMHEDFMADIRSMESESEVKVNLGHTVLWISGANAEAVFGARETLREMVQFYLPEGFQSKRNLGTRPFMDLLRQDAELRALTARPEGATYFDSTEQTGWICGTPEYRQAVQKRVDAMEAQWASEHWEMDLDNYGVAMWLLGPGGTGEWLGRMQAESGASIKICPNELKVYVEGKPHKVELGKKAVLDGIERLEAKRKAEEGITIGEVANKKAKNVLSEHPPHMQAILESLRALDAREAEAKRRARMREWDLERPVRPLPAAPAAPTGEGASAASNDATAASASAAEGSEEQREEWSALKDLRAKVAAAALKRQALPPSESRDAGIGRTMMGGAPANAKIQEPNNDQ